MSNLDPDGSLGPQLSLEQQLELDRICADFEKQWQQHPHQPPRLLTWLDRLPVSLTQALFRELLAIDIDHRRSRSMSVTRDQLQALYPDYHADIEHVLQVIADRDDGELVAPAQSLPQRLAAQQSEHLRQFIKSLEEAPVSELPSQIANWTQEQLSRARNLEQTLLRSTAGFSATAGHRNQLERLGDFRIIREIGRGGMGTVFEAEQLSLRRRVALKVLWFGGQQDSESIQRFEREATTIANLHHTNIVPIFAVGEQDGVNYYAMQLIEGQSLDALIKNSNAPCEPQSVIDWAVQAAEALVHAHERGVIHRDIKPSNLMLDASGRLWLTDFGLAKRDQDQSMSLAGVMLGTPRYMSPEQASTNLQSIDHRSDIYSLGATLYELLAGRPVFDGNTPFALIRQILSEEPQAVDRIQAGIPRDFATIVMKCLRKDARERYTTARELVADLRCVQEGRPIQARRAGLMEVAGKWVKRHQQSVRTTILATFVLMVVTVGSLLTWMTVQQYFTTQLHMKMVSTPTTVEFYDSQQEVAHSPVALPTTEPLKLQSEPLTLRFHGKGFPSIDYRWLAQPQAIDEFQIELDQQDWEYPQQPRADYQVVGAEPRQLIVSWTDERLYIDVPGTLQRPFQIQQSSEGLELRQLSDQTKVRWVASLGSDLDGDGVDEVLVALAQQAAVHLISRKTGKLWSQTFASAESELPKLEQPISASAHRGEVLQLPELVPDQDGDGNWDVLMTMGQNPHDPPSDATQTTRSVVLVSATGKLLWRYDLEAAWFQLPKGANVARELQWQLTDPYTMGTKNLSAFALRKGRRLRHLDRQLISEAPHVEAPQAKWLFDSGRDHVLVRTGTKLHLLDLNHGQLIQPLQETGIVSAVPLICRDLNDDGKPEIMLIESLPPINNPVAGSLMTSIPQTRLVVWSVQNQKPVWEAKVDSKPPAYTAPALTKTKTNERVVDTGHRWPVVVSSELHRPAWLILPWRIPPNVGYSGPSLPWSELAMVEAETGKLIWTCQVPNMDCWTDQIAVIPDINRDGTPEVAIASLWGQPFEWVVECRSGRDGELIWLQHQKLDESQFDEVASLIYLPKAGRLQLNLTNVQSNQTAFQMAPQSGEVIQSLRDFQGLEFLDFDGDAVDDWCITHSEMVAGVARETLRIIKGNFGDRWRRLGVPVQVGSDFDLDGIADLLSVEKNGVQAISSRTGAIMWQHQPSANWAECRASTWESEQSRLIAAGQPRNSLGVARREAWDVDHDSTQDVILQTVTIQSGESHPAILILSGRTGQLLWQSQTEFRQHEAMPPLTMGDLDNDDQLDILAIDWLISPNQGNQSGAGSGSSQKVSLTRWEVGSDKSLWTVLIEGESIDSIINRWNWEADLMSYPQPVFLETNRDGVVDLALVMDAETSAEAAAELAIGFVSGKDGSLAWAKPLGITAYDQRTIANSERYVATDVDGDGLDELLVLSFTNRQEKSDTLERVAQLRAWDAATGNLKWVFEYPVALDFLNASNTRSVKPKVGRGEKGQHWIVMPLRTRENRDVIVVVNGQGKLLDSHLLEPATNYYHQGFLCWVMDLDGDTVDELLADDGQGLVAFRVDHQLKLQQRFPVRAREVDVSVELMVVDEKPSHLVVTSNADYLATGFELQSGQALWRVVGPQAQKQYRADRNAVQVINRPWGGESKVGFDAPWIVFNGYRDETTLQMALPGRLTDPTQVGIEVLELPLIAAAEPTDFRKQRTLPWADPHSPFASWDRSSQFVTLIGFVLMASGLLIWLPYLIWRCMRSGWISHLGALLLGFLVAALNVLFLGQTFTVPFLLERPEWNDKLGVAFSYAPLWSVLYVVPQWIWRGAWRRGLVWLLLTLVLAAASGAWALYQDQLESPMVQGERYALSWSPALIALGVFAASWLGTLVWGAKRIFQGLTNFLEGRLGSSSRLVAAFRSWQPQTSRLALGSRTVGRPRYVRTLYLWGIFGIASWVVLCPDWKGVSYRPEGLSSPLNFQAGAVENGGFGLDQSSRHFLWDPPVSAGALTATVRWPWQSVSNLYHLEFDLRNMLLRVMGALAVWGGLLFILGAIARVERCDPGWLWVGLMTLLWTVALMASLIMQIFTMGYLPGAFELEIMFLAAWVIGYVGSRWLSRRRSSVPTTESKSSVADTDDQLASSSEKSGPREGTVRFLMDGWLFVMGFALALGVGLWLVNVMPEIVDPEWQPAMGPGLGGPRAGTMNLIGWIYLGLAATSGLVFCWWRSLRGLGLGLFLGWMVWAIFCWFYK